MEFVSVVPVSHFLAAFRPVPQSCISNTFLRHITKPSSSHATLSPTFIIKQALSARKGDSDGQKVEFRSFLEIMVKPLAFPIVF